MLRSGFEIPWSSDELAYVRHGEASFLLQAFDEPEFIQNYQMHLLVANVDDWHTHLLSTGVVTRFSVKAARLMTGRGECETSHSSTLAVFCGESRRTIRKRPGCSFRRFTSHLGQKRTGISPDPPIVEWDNDERCVD